MSVPPTPILSGSYLVYLRHFGLSGRPFSLLPDPDFLYWTTNHKLAFAMLEFGLTTFAPITVITGEIGAGKTTLIHHLLRSAPRDLRIGFIANALGRQDELLDWVLRAFGDEGEPGASYVSRFGRFEDLLRRQFEEGRGTVLVVDEAQNLSKEQFEELRCYSNLNGAKDEMLQIILVGQPELERILKRSEMAQLMQRVSSHCHLTGMPGEVVGEYIDHRLKVAGATRRIFRPETAGPIAEASRGVPRLINQICDRALVYAFAQDRKTIDARLINQAIAEGDGWRTGM